VADVTTTVCTREQAPRSWRGEGTPRPVATTHRGLAVREHDVLVLHDGICPHEDGPGQEVQREAARGGRGEARARNKNRGGEVFGMLPHSPASGPPLPSPVCRALEGDGLGNVPVACRSKRWVADTSEGAVGAAGAKSAHQKNGTLNARRTERRDGADDGDALARVHRGGNAEGHAAEKGGRGGCEARSGLVRGEGIHAREKKANTNLRTDDGIFGGATVGAGQTVVFKVGM
jgi:hypothetical protein